MGYSLRDLPRLAKTADGRWEIGRGVAYRLWPALRPAAALWRRTALAQTTLVAVVGSLGKTTATRCVAAALDEPLPRLPFNQFGLLAMNILAIPPLRKRAAIEVGIQRRGEMAAYAAMIQPTIVVVTSIASDHIRSLGNLETIAEEKAEMVRRLSPTGTAVLNGDDPRVLAMRATTEARIITYGFARDNQVRCLQAQLDWPRGTVLTVDVDGRIMEIRSRLFGRVMVFPVLAAIAAAVAAGIAPEEAAQRLESVEPTPGRLAPMLLSSGAVVLRDDYKAPIESFAPAIELLSEIPARRRLVAFGAITESPGSQGPVYRMAAAPISPICDGAFLTGNNARRWSAGLAAGGMARNKIVRCRGGWADVAERLRQDLGPGDVVLIKGRNEQRLERIALALAGEKIHCSLPTCHAVNLACHRCGARGHASAHGTAVHAPAEEYSPGLLDSIRGTLWRRHNDRVVNDFITRHVRAPSQGVILKTNVLEEALGSDLLPRASVGMDLSWTVLRAAQRRFPDAPLVRADVRQLPFSDASLAGAISTSTLDHSRDPGDLARSLDELGRVLRPGATLLLTLNNPRNPLLALRNVLPHAFRSFVELTPYYVGYTCDPAHVEGLLGQAGFEVRKTDAILHIPRALTALSGRASRLVGLDRIDGTILALFRRAEILRHCPTRWLSGHYIAIVAVKIDPRGQTRPRPTRA